MRWLAIVVISATVLCICVFWIGRQQPVATDRPLQPRVESSKDNDSTVQRNVTKWNLPSRINASLHGGSVSGPVWLLELSRFPNTHSVCITFDIHFDKDQLNAILETLRTNHVKATFFLTGHWAKTFPDAVRQITTDGHELGNHTFSHKDLTHLADEQILGEVRRTEASIVEAAGNRDSIRRFVRYPYGSRNRRVVTVLLKHGYIPVYWGLDSRDSMRGITADQIRDRVLEKVQPGDIVLMHASSPLTAVVLPEILDGLKSRGLKPLSLTEMLQEGPYVPSSAS